MEFAEIYITPEEENLFKDPKHFNSFMAQSSIDTVQFLYGWMYRYGIHYAKNLKEAYEWFRVSAKNGNIRAIQSLLSLHCDLENSPQKPPYLASAEELKNYFPILEREFLKKDPFYLSYLSPYTACLYYGRGCAVNQRKACLLLIEAILGMAAITPSTKKIVNILHGVIYKNNPELRSLINDLFTQKPALKILIDIPVLPEERISALMREAMLPLRATPAIPAQKALPSLPALKPTLSIVPLRRTPAIPAQKYSADIRALKSTPAILAQEKEEYSEINMLNTHLTRIEASNQQHTVCIQKQFQSFTKELCSIGTQLERVGQLLKQVETLSKQNRQDLSVKLQNGISKPSSSSSSSASLSLSTKSNGLEDLLLAINSEVEFEEVQFEIEDPSSDVEIIESPKNKGTKRKADQKDANTEPAKRRKP